MLTNSKHAPAIGAKVQELALERFLGVGTPPELAAVPCAPEELVGLYDMGPYAWSLTSTEGRLFVEMRIPDDVPEEIKVAFANPARELGAVGSDVFALARPGETQPRTPERSMASMLPPR